MQATGGDLMRIFCVLLERQGVRLLLPQHDGFLVSCQKSQLTQAKEAIDYAAREAVRKTLGDFPLRWTYSGPFSERFREEDGQALWGRVRGVLGTLGKAKGSPPKTAE
jgi:hypothetical protein